MAETTILAGVAKNNQSQRIKEIVFHAVNNKVTDNNEILMKSDALDITGESIWFKRYPVVLDGTDVEIPNVALDSTLKWSAYFIDENEMIVSPLGITRNTVSPEIFSIPLGSSEVTWQQVAEYSNGNLAPENGGDVHVEGNLSVKQLLQVEGISELAGGVQTSFIEAATATFSGRVTAAGGYGGIKSTDIPSPLANSTLNGATLNDSVLNEPIINDPTYTGDVHYPGDLTADGDIIGRHVGDGSALVNVNSGTTITPNTLASEGSVALSADITPQSSSGGIVALLTRNQEGLQVGNKGGLGIWMPGDYGTQGNGALLNFKNFENGDADGRLWNILKAWSSDPDAPTAANFTFFGHKGPNPGTNRKMQGYYWGTNLGRGGKEFVGEGTIVFGLETYWTGPPFSVANPAQEFWLLMGGMDGSAPQRVLFISQPHLAPQNAQIEWCINQMNFGDYTNRNTWMRFSPGKVEFFETPEAPTPQIVTPVGDPLIFRGTSPYPFVNDAGETEVGRDSDIIRFMSEHDTIDPNAMWQFILGKGANKPGWRYNGGFEYSDNGTTFVKFSESTKGLHRLTRNLENEAGSYSLIGTGVAAGDGANARAAIVTLYETDNAGTGGAQMFHVPLHFYGTQNVWVEVPPLTSLNSAFAVTHLKLDVKTDGDNVPTFRIRRGTTIANPTSVFIELRLLVGNGTLTLSNETGVDATVTGKLQTVVSTTRVDYGDGVIDTVGNGSPEGVVTASPGSTYHNRAGGANTSFYVKESGVNTNTGWTAK